MPSEAEICNQENTIHNHDHSSRHAKNLRTIWRASHTFQHALIFLVNLGGKDILLPSNDIKDSAFNIDMWYKAEMKSWQI